MDRDSGAAVYEFFAGGGMARLGLDGFWRTTFANDWSAEKTSAYAAAFGLPDLAARDVWSLGAADLPGRPTLAWASFPCQDLSLAGMRGGLAAPRSGAFWGFWRLIEALSAEGRAPPLLAFENVSGLLSSRGGADFAALGEALAGLGYHFGAVEIDAAHFVPQSRPRIFVVAARRAPDTLTRAAPEAPLQPARLVAAVGKLSPPAAKAHVWWRMPQPPRRNTVLGDLLEPDDAVPWRSAAETRALVALMAPRHAARIAEALAMGGRQVGAVFRRVRVEDGVRRQRAEIRFDGLAGCLRTPAGGSSRQFLLVTEGGEMRSRLLTGREGARLMGLPDSYPLPARASQALHLVGDGVCVPAVRWLSENLLEPLADANAR